MEYEIEVSYDDRMPVGERISARYRSAEAISNDTPWVEEPRDDVERRFGHAARMTITDSPKARMVFKIKHLEEITETQPK